MEGIGHVCVCQKHCLVFEPLVKGTLISERNWCRNYFVVLCLLFSMCYMSCASCTSDVGRRVVVTLDAQRNATGYWIMKVDAEDAAPRAPQQRVAVRAELFAPRGPHGAVHLTSTTVLHRVVPPGYESVLGVGFYKLHAAGLPWQDAMRTCEAEGGHLMVIDSADEAAVVRELFARKPKITNAHNNLWLAIGFHDRYADRKFETVLGDRFTDTDYMKWLPGEPHGETHHCGIINKDAAVAADPCTTSWAFICEAY